MKITLSLIFILFFLAISLGGCNTIAGTTKGVIEDIREIVPGI